MVREVPRQRGDGWGGNAVILGREFTTHWRQALSEDQEVVVVVSKIKNYIREKSTMNTSGSVAEALSDRVRTLCDQAIENARKDGRKTVMDRDIPSV